MITFEQVSKYYGNIAAVQDVSFTADSGAVTGLLGLNGAGKTTLLKAAAALHYPSSGTVTVCGIDTVADPQTVRRLTGYAPEQPTFSVAYADYTAVEFLHATARIRLAACGSAAPADVTAAVERVVDLCDLGSVVHRRIAALSKGYTQRLSLAQALVHDPAVLILDEPTSGLDPAQIHQTRAIIRGLADDAAVGKTILLSTHLMQEVEALCGTIHIVHHGTLVQSGHKDDILTATAAATLEDAFLSLTG